MMGPLVFGLLIAVGVLSLFAAIWYFLDKQDAVDERLAQYGRGADFTLVPEAPQRTLSNRQRLNRLIARLGFGSTQAELLNQADLPLTLAEFTILRIGLAASAFLIGFLRWGVIPAVVAAIVGLYVPVLFARYRRDRRRQQFTEQVPQMLSLLVGALRSGYGLTQSINLIVEQIGEPASKELARVLQSVELGYPIQQALQQMANRIGTDEIDMLVTAINIQYETGGNLAETLDVIGETVRDRLRIKREIRVLTAQQRITGYILAVLPLGLMGLLFILNPQYMGRLFEPGWIRLLPALALLMQVAGFLVIRRIVNIEV